MDFQQQLESIKQRIEGNLPVEYVNIMHNATKALEESGIQDRVLKVGDKAPSFQLKNQDGELVSSDELLQNGALVLTFYRGVWCPYCNADLANLNNYLEQTQEAGATMIGLSPELPEFLKKARKTNRLAFDLLSDTNNKVATQFGLTFELPQDLKELYRDKFNIDLEKHQGNDAWELPMPARFVIGQDGIIQYAESHPDYRSRPNPDDLIEVLGRDGMHCGDGMHPVSAQ